MFRYYMTPETRQAVIAESNRLIANRAALSASRSRRETGFDSEPGEEGALVPHGDVDAAEADSESAFARLVEDLQSSAGKAFNPGRSTSA